ncbi:hypothetical protein A9Q78_05600 [Methylophaga sp. 41_12_T18]|nr:hypothetical protein A9Q78_05600 [Methylophaga sp. 41_12_T18]
MTLSLKQKITFAAVLLCAVPLIISAVLTNSIASNNATLALQQASQQRLISLRDVKKQQIEDYFSTINNQLLNLSNSAFTSTAVSEFSQAVKSYAYESSQLDKSTVTKQVKHYYDNDFSNRYQQKNGDNIQLDSSTLLRQLDSDALALQNTFIAQNPAALGEKDALISANDGSQYSYYHAKYHPYLRDFLNRFGFYDIFLVDADSGMIVYSVYKELDYATSLIDGPYANSGIGQAFKAANEATNNSYSYIADFAAYTPSYEDAASFIAAPIFEQGVKKGVLIFQMPVDRINQIMTFDGNWTQAGLGESGETYLVGPDMTSRSESRFLVEDKPAYLEALRQNKDLNPNLIALIDKKDTALGLQPVETLGSRAAISGKSGFNIFPDYRGVNVLSAYTPLSIPGLDWALLAEIDEAEAFLPANELSTTLWLSGIVIFVVVVLLAVIAAIKFSTLLATPILDISHFITKVASTLDLTSRLEMKRTDEIRDAADSLNNLLHTFQQSLIEVTDASNQIAAASEQTSVITASTSEAIEVQKNETIQVSSAMTEMVATVNNVAMSTTQTAQYSEEANTHVREGAELMKTTISVIHHLATTIADTNESTSQLEQRSVDISSVLSVISSIAEQTNLLALNAAIEAARAGEHGRGFAVVADEVRTLASRTQESTGEISKMIELLQQGSKDAVKSMLSSQDQVNNAVQQTDATGEQLTLISNLIQQISDMSNQIATASEQQGAVSEEINRNIIKINDMTDQTAEGAHQTSIASGELARLAAELNTLVQRFNV